MRRTGSGALAQRIIRLRVQHFRGLATRAVVASDTNAHGGAGRKARATGTTVRHTSNARRNKKLCTSAPLARTRHRHRERASIYIQRPSPAFVSTSKKTRAISARPSPDHAALVAQPELGRNLLHDLEGAVELVARMPRRYAEARARHGQRRRREADDHDGQVAR